MSRHWEREGTSIPGRGHQEQRLAPKKHSRVVPASLSVTPGHSIREGRPGGGAVKVIRPLGLGSPENSRSQQRARSKAVQEDRQAGRKWKECWQAQSGKGQPRSPSLLLSSQSAHSSAQPSASSKPSRAGSELSYNFPARAQMPLLSCGIPDPIALHAGQHVRALS